MIPTLPDPEAFAADSQENRTGYDETHPHVRVLAAVLCEPEREVADALNCGAGLHTQNLT